MPLSPRWRKARRSTPPSQIQPPIKSRNPWLRVFTVANILALAFLWWLENGVGERTNPTALLLYMPQHPLAIPTFLLMVASGWKRNFPLVASNVCLLCLWMFSFGGVQVPWPPQKSPRPTVRVVMWNVRYWNLGPQEGPRQLRSLSPDVICLAEAFPPAPRKKIPLFNLNSKTVWESQFPGWHVVQALNMATLSRFPLINSRIVSIPGIEDRCMVIACWRTPQGPLTTATVHISTDFKGSHPEQKPDYTDPRRWKQIAAHAKLTADMRAAQLPYLQYAVADVSGPLIIAGDFNNPPRGHLYHRLTENWTDAFAQAGWGTGFTFPATHPLMRIDYLWLSPTLQATRCFSPPTSASDHRPVVADIAF